MVFARNKFRISFHRLEILDDLQGVCLVCTYSLFNCRSPEPLNLIVILFPDYQHYGTTLPSLHLSKSRLGYFELYEVYPSLIKDCFKICPPISTYWEGSIVSLKLVQNSISICEVKK